MASTPIFLLFMQLLLQKKCNFAPAIAVVAQLVEHWLPKPRVAGSSPVYRSSSKYYLILAG